MEAARSPGRWTSGPCRDILLDLPGSGGRNLQSPASNLQLHTSGLPPPRVSHP